MEWVNINDRFPVIDAIIDRHGNKFKESKYVFARIQFVNGRTINVNAIFTKSITRPNEAIKVKIQHFNGGTHPNDFSGYSEKIILMEHIKNLVWLDEENG